MYFKGKEYYSIPFPSITTVFRIRGSIEFPVCLVSSAVKHINYNDTRRWFVPALLLSAKCERISPQLSGELCDGDIRHETRELALSWISEASLDSSSFHKLWISPVERPRTIPILDHGLSETLNTFRQGFAAPYKLRGRLTDVLPSFTSREVHTFQDCQQDRDSTRNQCVED
jgi:hypothetical protein